MGSEGTGTAQSYLVFSSVDSLHQITKMKVWVIGRWLPIFQVQDWKGSQAQSQMATPEFDGKAVEVVARKANVSAKTFERAKKIIEEGTEEQKVWVPKEWFYFSVLNQELNSCKLARAELKIETQIVFFRSRN